jgi:adenylosuccinate synthase
VFVACLQERGVSVEGRLLISDRAHMLFELHKEIDGAREAELAGTGKQVGGWQAGWVAGRVGGWMIDASCVFVRCGR